ncbi:hypothetical protein MLP_48640 [Microlunatus phosphovorus NM-1]|uniref:Polysaccharide chain length determinant N-terminal domain-containing protein n=1 Tax=Microlunatus phosphovorus (strain ATCC 700054 / DSM 10555 / JCM 9379 / NBRC 101784 / NCIMB 13414 / VKM Ac-1990 / NM-1) TaxID=1032480 RepID=F5XFE0_MICPN|nr:hypothetical protein [Microlunatus phosphovorus]BAK37878.1 hypothetical protein MLP_48640 [Microlunatus phosphovorus NM-1]
MDVWGITLATLRRWYVCLPIVAVAVLMALLAGRTASPEYDATGTVMLTPPRVSSEIANPFINVQGASEALTVILNGPETAAQLDERGLTGGVIVTSGSRTSVIVMRSTAGDQANALGLIDAAIEIGEHELETRQDEAGIAKSSYIGMEVLAAPSITGIANDTAVRVQAVILGLGAVVGVTLAVLFDDIMGFIRRRRGERQGGVPGGKRGKKRKGLEDKVEAGTGDGEESDSKPPNQSEDSINEEQSPTGTVPVADLESSNEAGVSSDSPGAKQVDTGPDSQPAASEDVAVEVELHENEDSGTQGSGATDGPDSVDVDESEAASASLEVNGQDSAADSDYVSTSQPQRGQ